MKVTPIISATRSKFDHSGKPFTQKKKYKVILNWYGENRQFYTTAKSKRSALSNAIRQLSNATGILFSVIQLRLFTNSNAYKIEEQK